MNKNKKYLALAISLPLALPAFADETTVGVFTQTRHDIDYHRNTLGVSVQMITPAGLFRCDPAVHSGKTRIDSFNNIIGLGDVRDAQWKDFSAKDIECRYGAKWDLAGGTLKAGVGFRNYAGETANEPGGKDIQIDGYGTLLDYENKQFKATLDWKQEVHDYTLRNQASYGNYDSLVDIREDTLILTATTDALYTQATHVRGEKENVYTTALFPPNTFHFDYLDLALGMRFYPQGNGLTLAAPIFGTGSYRGSFNPIESDPGLKGVYLAGHYNGYDIDFKVLRHKGDGNRPYLPATDDVTEELKDTTITVGVKKDDWTFELENSRSTHNGKATITDPLYILLVGGTGPYNNQRKENKWEVSGTYKARKDLLIDFSLYYTLRDDRQYDLPEHSYDEAGGFLQLSFLQ